MLTHAQQTAMLAALAMFTVGVLVLLLECEWVQISLVLCTVCVCVCLTGELASPYMMPYMHGVMRPRTMSCQLTANCSTFKA